MKKKNLTIMIRIALAVGTAISLYFVPWTILFTWLKPLPDTVQEQAQAAIELGFDGIIVYVDQAGEAPAYYTAGYHNREDKTPAKPQALFKIASISKLYDAVAVAKLVKEGRLSLDKSIADYLPELKGRIQYAENITLRLMLQHRSGLPNFTDTPDFWASPTQTYEESIALVLDEPANFKPDKKYQYCNTNYLLINKIMDDELGYPNFQYIKKEILNPLNLSHTYASLAEVQIEDVMSGYHVGYPYDLKEGKHGMHATAKDVGTFIRALNDGSVFKEGEKEIYDGIYKYEHAGWVPGYQSFAKYDQELDAVFVEFYSTTDPKLYNWNLSEVINSRIEKIVRKNAGQ